MFVSQFVSQPSPVGKSCSFQMQVAIARPDGCPLPVPAFPPRKDALCPTGAPGKAPTTSTLADLCQTAHQDSLPAADEPRCGEGGLRRQRGLCAACLLSCASLTAWLDIEDKKAPQSVAKGLSTVPPVPWEVSFGGSSFPPFPAVAVPCLRRAARGAAAVAPLRRVILQHVGGPPSLGGQHNPTWAGTCPRGALQRPGFG